MPNLRCFCPAQVKPLASFHLEVTLRVGGGCGSGQTEVWAQQVASVSAELLLKHGVTVHISLKSSTTSPASPAILQTLAPLLHSVDLTPRQRGGTNVVSSAVKLAHLAALQHCSTTLDALYISHSHAPLLPTAGSIAGIAQLSSLTKLHLSLQNAGEQDVNFRPLSQLSILEDLTLQSCRTVCCAHVLRSSKQSLRCISLTGKRWRSATYEALQDMSHLDNLFVKLWRSMRSAQACAVAELRANHVELYLCRTDDRHVLSALSSLQSGIHHLTLCHLGDRQSAGLKSQDTLETLTIANSPLLTASSLQVHPNVTELTLIECPSITVAGLRHLLSTTLPALTKLTVHAARFATSYGIWSPTSRCLQHKDLQRLCSHIGDYPMTSSADPLIFKYSKGL